MHIRLTSPNGPWASRWASSRWASLVPQAQLTHNLLTYEFYFIFKKDIINVFNLYVKYLVYLVYIYNIYLIYENQPNCTTLQGLKPHCTTP